ncbi:MAG: hypothetical protein U0835_13995 [Isosphaeraceae bacterium]
MQSGVFEILAWRFWRCPRTLEAAASDFVDDRNGPRIRQVLADPESWTEDVVIAWKRRIASTYGLARSYGTLCDQAAWPVDWKRRLLADESAQAAALPDGTWSRGWNHRLLAEAGPAPEVAAERILKRAFELARLSADSAAELEAENGGGERDAGTSYRSSGRDS